MNSTIRSQVNVHVANIMETQAEKRGQHIPRMDSCNMALGSLMAGVSAFAFQGTNAHAILRRLSSSIGSLRNDKNWHRRRAWYENHISFLHLHSIFFL